MKRIRIVYTLLISSFKSVFFNHQHYFLFCILLVAIQFIHLKLTGLIHHRLTPGILITELLAGGNFFEILWHNTYFTYPTTNFFYTIIVFTALLYIEIILIFFVLSAVSHYTFKHQANSLRECLKASLKRWRALSAWGLFELCAQGVSSLLGNIGALFYFIWNIITIFDVQILSFDDISAYDVLKKSWKLFKQNVSEVVAFDVIIEGLLIIAGLVLYAIFRQYIPGIRLAGLENYNDIIIILILYLISSVMVLEVVVFTNLYKIIEKRKKN